MYMRGSPNSHENLNKSLSVPLVHCGEKSGRADFIYNMIFILPFALFITSSLGGTAHRERLGRNDADVCVLPQN